jgi:molybdopterin molybdotransferase
MSPAPPPTSVQGHLETILSIATTLSAERCALDAALGRTLAAPVHARVDLPAFDNSAMDGFAVRFADVADATPARPAVLRVIADVPAGSTADPTLAPGTAARIMTGAAMPSAADTVVPFEDTRGGLADSLTTVSVSRAPRAVGAHVRRAGEDARRGQPLLAAGALLGPHQLSGAAAAGVAEVVVTRVPRVAVLSTGSELTAPGAPLGRGQIPESNSRLLAALAVEAGAAVVHCESVPDDPVRLRRLVEELAGGSSPAPADAVILSGGISAGAYEVVKQALAHAMAFTEVAMKPGKPQGFGRLADGGLLFGLPGNPVGAAVSFEAFVRPALLRMQGRTALRRPTLDVTTTVGWPSPAGWRHYVPVALDRSDPGAWRVRPAGPGGSHRAGTLAGADGYAVVPPDIDAVRAGDTVEVVLLP